MKGIKPLFLLPILLAGATLDSPAEALDKINICHLDEVVEFGILGTVIRIPVQAWPAHERHLDYQTTSEVGDACGIIDLDPPE